MMAPFGQLWGAHCRVFAHLVLRCRHMFRRQPQGPNWCGRRAFLRAASGVLGSGCAAAPALLSAAQTPPRGQGGPPQRWEELTATELTGALRQTSLVYVPIGTFLEYVRKAR
jgi:hypothetical protein